MAPLPHPTSSHDPQVIECVRRHKCVTLALLKAYSSWQRNISHTKHVLIFSVLNIKNLHSVKCKWCFQELNFPNSYLNVIYWKQIWLRKDIVVVTMDRCVCQSHELARRSESKQNNNSSENIIWRFTSFDNHLRVSVWSKLLDKTEKNKN